MNFSKRVSSFIKKHPIQFYAIAGYYSTLDSNQGGIGNIADVVRAVAQTMPAVVHNPVAVTAIAAPAAVSAVVSVATASLGTSSLGLGMNGFLQLGLSSVSGLFATKKKTQYGIVYDATTQKPVAGAIVQLYDHSNNRTVASTITKKDGRYIFSAKAGSYVIKVAKPGFVFPSKIAGAGQAVTESYTGQTIAVDAENPAINYFIPIDPDTDAKLNMSLFIKIFSSNSFRHLLFLMGTFMAVYSFTLSPSTLGYASVGAFLLLWIVELRHSSRRVKYSKIVDSKTRKSISLAVIRIIDASGRSIETFVSDQFGQVLPKTGVVGQKVLIEKAGYRAVEYLPQRQGLVQRQVFLLIKNQQ